MDFIFEFLCGILYLIGYPFGLSYEETSIYVCIYLWPSLCVLSTIPIIWASVKRIKVNRIVGIVCLLFSLIYFSYYCYYTNFIIERYNISNPNSFNNCLLDLKSLSEIIKISYANLNMYIYIFGFSAIQIFNFILFKVINPKCKNVK